MLFKEALKYKLLEIEGKLPDGEAYFEYEKTGSRSIGALFNFDGWSSTLRTDLATPCFLPTGVPLQVRVYEHVPCTMVRESYYKNHILGKELPWLQGHKLRFPTENSILPMLPGSKMGLKVLFGGVADLAPWFGVKGMGLLPFLMNGIPFLLHALIVDDIFPMQPASLGVSRFDAVINAWDVLASAVGAVTLGRGSILMPLIRNAQQFRTGCLDIRDGVLRVHVDGVCINTGDNNLQGGMGIYFSDGSVYNVWDTLNVQEDEQENEEILARKNDCSKLCAAYAALQTCFKIIKYHGYFGIIKKLHIFSHSAYLISGMNVGLSMWKHQGPGKARWTRADGRPILHEEFWKSLDALVNHVKLTIGLVVEFSLIENEHNKAAEKLAIEGAIGERYGEASTIHCSNREWNMKWNETLNMDMAPPKTDFSVNDMNTHTVVQAWWRELGIPTYCDVKIINATN